MLSIITAGLVALTSIFLAIVKGWRINLGILVIQYVGVFLMVGMEWSLSLAFTQLIAGWIAICIMGMPLLSISEKHNGHLLFSEPGQTLNVMFYILAAIFVGLVSTSAAPILTRQTPGIDIQQTWGGLILIGMGLFRLSFTSRPLPVICSLLTLVSGIEVLYAPIDSSPFTAGFFAVITLGLALTGSYLLIAPYSEERA